MWIFSWLLKNQTDFKNLSDPKLNSIVFKNVLQTWSNLKTGQQDLFYLCV